MTRYQTAFFLTAFVAGTLGASGAPPAPCPPAASPAPAATPLPITSPTPPPPPPPLLNPTPLATPTSPSDLPTASPTPSGPPGRAYAPNMAPIPVPPPISLPPPSNLPPDVPLRPLTMDEAVAISLRHQPTIDSAAAGVTLAAGKTMATRAPENPQLNVSAQYLLLSTELNPTTTSSGGGSGSGGSSSSTQAATTHVVNEAAPLGLTVSVTGSQLIYDFQHIRSQVQESQEQERLAQATLTQNQADTVLTVKQDFITYVQDQRLIQVEEVSVKDEAEHLRQAEGLYRAGTGLPSDVVQAQAALADAINSLVAAQNTSDTARIALALALGIDPRTPLLTTSSNESEIDDSDLQKLIDLGLQLRPEVQEALYTVRADEYGVKAAYTTSAPAISGFMELENLPFGGTQINLLTAGIQMTWVAGDGGLTRGEVMQAKAILQQGQDQLRSARLTVISDTTTAYLTLHSALQRLDDLQVDVRAAQETLRLDNGRYAAGIGLALQVLDDESALVTALTNEVNAVATIETARAQLAHAIGTPPPAIAPLKPQDQDKAPKALAAPPAPFPIPSPVPSQSPVPAPPITLPYIAPVPQAGSSKTVNPESVPTPVSTPTPVPAPTPTPIPPKTTSPPPPGPSPSPTTPSPAPGTQTTPGVIEPPSPAPSREPWP